MTTAATASKARWQQQCQRLTMTVNVIIKVKLSKFVNGGASAADGGGQFYTTNRIFNGVTCKN